MTEAFWLVWGAFWGWWAFWWGIDARNAVVGALSDPCRRFRGSRNLTEELDHALTQLEIEYGVPAYRHRKVGTPAFRFRGDGAVKILHPTWRPESDD